MLGDKNNNQGLADGSALVSRGVPTNKAMENNENTRGVTIAAILGIPVTLAGKFTKIQQAGLQGDNWKAEDSRLRPQPMIRILTLAN